ncbi:MAG TPA: peroxidase family protein, partial [Nitrospirales bacterium]|nr:peroxidase family protein [Nitrospirales bacterium]
DLPGIDLTGFMGGWWAGLSVLHTLFSLEHNAICRMLRQTYARDPRNNLPWTDEALFQIARLINAALMSKIHTVEWTPGILSMPIMKVALEANWWGVLGPNIKRQFGRIAESEAISGILGSIRDHHGVPFGFTEEFVSIYRLHPLIPDVFRFQSLDDPLEVFTLQGANGRSRIIETFDQIQGRNTRRAIDAIRMRNVIYSFGIAHPGAVTLGNFPHFLRNYTSPDDPGQHLLDVATIDILRDRERGIPKYNRFRQLLRKPPIRSFEELNCRWAERLRVLYDNDVDKIDTMVGLFAEEPPPGFGFSDTAFRIFILMASRRLKSDRFYTNDYREDIYTEAGLRWIDDENFGSVLRRHYPALGPALDGVANPFSPWRAVHDA